MSSFPPAGSSEAEAINSPQRGGQPVRPTEPAPGPGFLKPVWFDLASARGSLRVSFRLVWLIWDQPAVAVSKTGIRIWSGGNNPRSDEVSPADTTCLKKPVRDGTVSDSPEHSSLS